MVVTAGAADRQAEERRAGGINPIGEPLVGRFLGLHVRFMNLRPQGEQAGCNAGFQVALLLRRDLKTAVQVQIVRPKLVRRQLFLDEAVIGLIVIE